MCTLHRAADSVRDKHVIHVYEQYTVMNAWRYEANQRSKESSRREAHISVGRSRNVTVSFDLDPTMTN